MLEVGILYSSLLIAQVQKPPRQFLQLKNQLEKYGFEVIIKLPPRRGAYGLLQVANKKIWINPVVFDLHIANPTLVHESVHAAQLCAGKGKMKTLGLDIQPIPAARRLFLRYTNIHRQDLEREAYAVQTQPNSFEIATTLLQKHCIPLSVSQKSTPLLLPPRGEVTHSKVGLTQLAYFFCSSHPPVPKTPPGDFPQGVLRFPLNFCSKNVK
ncbi:MAG: hypothetical protein QNJ51_02580 [Calothrix sp. MO_167.B12]|nr:hypothetical protein [Calothrix sp. MO_167.B12]